MAKRKLPATLKPEPITIGQEMLGAFDEWFAHGGGKSVGKARPVIHGDDPRNQVDIGAEASLEPEFYGFSPTGEAIFKPAPQKGKPDLPPITLGENAGGHPDASAELGGTDAFTPEQIQMLLEEIYGKQGAARNATAGKRPGRKTLSTPISGQGPSSFSTPLPMPRSGVFSTPMPPSRGGTMINLPGPPTTGLRPGGKIGPPDLKTLLAQLARSQGR